MYLYISLLVLTISLTACTSQQQAVTTGTDPESSVQLDVVNQDNGSPPEGAGVRPELKPGLEQAGETNDERNDKVSLGTGVFVQPAKISRPEAYSAESGIELNFERAALAEFLQVVIQNILQENYIIDPGVKGSVTLHTTRPVTKDAVLSILELVLQQNGAALIRDEGLFKVVPLEDAGSEVSAPSVGQFTSRKSVGYTVQVVPLEHVSARELRKIIEPFMSDGASIRVDEARNVLILSGPKYRLEELLATIRTFDVDWLKGMSFAMFRLKYADAKTLVEELQVVLQDESTLPLGGIVRLLPIERLNAVLVVTHQPDRIAQFQRLIEQFDWGIEGSGGRRLYVYNLQNGKAENIATVLQEIFGQTTQNFTGESSDSHGNVFRTADSLSKGVNGRENAGSASSSGSDFGSGTGSGNSSGKKGVTTEKSGEVKIIADVDNNSILVLASENDYRAIEAAIRKLDIAPRQVLITANIAEVSLSNTLDNGVRWFVENSNSEVGFNAPVPSSASGEGLAFAFFDTGSEVTAFFDLLATESTVKFLSTPQVMVLDNQTATIRVGDQIPVTTRSSQSTTNPDAPIVTEVQFRDTGTLLTVTPRINAGGQVTLDISQEVSLPGTEPAVGGGGNVAIAQRTINSSVIVQSGQTVVLGGLILETTSNGKSGIPVLMDIPLLGRAFSTKTEDVFRTELIVTVEPRVVENGRMMRQVTEELRMLMQKASDYEQMVKQKGGIR
jgi:general secretion pathway protein D